MQMYKKFRTTVEQMFCFNERVVAFASFQLTYYCSHIIPADEMGGKRIINFGVNITRKPVFKLLTKIEMGIRVIDSKYLLKEKFECISYSRFSYSVSYSIDRRGIRL